MSKIDELRNHTWVSRAAAVKELKQHGLAETGDDYTLSETTEGSNVWYLADRTDDATQDVPRKAPKQGPKPGREKRKAAKGKLGPVEPEHKSDDPVVDWFINNTVQHKSDPAPEEPTNDLSPLPAEGGPYGLGAADPVAQHSVVETALSWSRKVGARIAIHSKGKVVRVIDGRIGAPAVRKSNGARSTGKSAEAVRLLMRENGATKADIVAVTEWSFGERYIRRLAGTTKTRMETLGKDHWRLIKD